MKATAPFAYAYVCAEGWTDEEEYYADQPELPAQENATGVEHLKQLDNESDSVVDHENETVIDASIAW